MRLPQHQSGQVQSLQGVDPNAYRQAGEGIAQIGEAAVNVGEAAHQAMLERDVQAGKMANHAQRQQLADLKTELETNEYLPADSPLLEGVENYNTRPDGTVLTSEVAAQIYENQATSYANANAENMRDGRVRRTWEESQRTSIAEQSANIAISAERAAKQERKLEDARMLRQAVDNQDFEGAKQVVAMGNWSDQEKKDRLHAIGVSQETTSVDNVILARDLNGIDQQIDLMSKPQKDYPGELSTEARIQQRARLESARKSILAGQRAHDKAVRGVALLRLNEAKDDYLAGGETSPGQLMELTHELSDDIGIPVDVLLGKGEMDYSGMDVADAKLVYEYRQLSADFENFELIASGTRDSVQDHMGKLREEAATGGAEEALRYQRALDYEEKMEQSKRDDPLTLADRHSITGPRPAFDINNIDGTLPAELEASRTASEHYGVPDRVVTDNTLVQIQDAWDNAQSTDERMALMTQINSHLPDAAAKHTFWADRMSDSSAGAAWVAGDMAEVGARTGDARSLSRSRDVLAGQAILDNPDNAVLLEAKDWGKQERKDAELEIAPEMHRLFPLDHQARTKAVTAAATAQIMKGTPPDRAVRRAMEAVQGGPLVRSQGSSETVKPPTPRMPENEFRRGQQGISDNYYASIGYTREDLRQQVIDGDVVFEDTGLEPGTYYLKDAGTNMYVEHEGEIPVIQWSQIDDVGPARGRLARALAGSQTAADSSAEFRELIAEREAEALRVRGEKRKREQQEIFKRRKEKIEETRQRVFFPEGAPAR